VDGKPDPVAAMPDPVAPWRDSPVGDLVAVGHRGAVTVFAPVGYAGEDARRRGGTWDVQKDIFDASARGSSPTV
jgi:hypothetical protein